MPNIQVKNVPPETHAILRDLAAKNHQSLQEFILQTLIETSKIPTDRELFERLQADMARHREDREPLDVKDVLDILDEGRASR